MENGGPSRRKQTCNNIAWEDTREKVEASPYIRRYRAYNSRRTSATFYPFLFPKLHPRLLLLLLLLLLMINYYISAYLERLGSSFRTEIQPARHV